MTKLSFWSQALVPRKWQELDRPIFVVGCSRSGTTAFIEHFRLHDLLCDWSEAAQIMEPNFYDPELDHLRTEEAATRENCWRLRFMFGAKTYLSRKRRFINKHPENSLRMGFIKAVFPDALFVHIIRDGHAVVASNYSRTQIDPFRRLWPFGQFPKPPCWRAILDKPPAVQFAYQWRDIVMFIRGFAAGQLSPRTYLEIRYESFCEDTRATVASVDKFCGLEGGKRKWSRIPNKLPNFNRRWDKIIPESDVSSVEQIIGPLNHELGYSSETNAK
jgi:hypothetical protein